MKATVFKRGFFLEAWEGLVNKITIPLSLIRPCMCIEELWISLRDIN